jgi:hypothetical protein
VDDEKLPALTRGERLQFPSAASEKSSGSVAPAQLPVWLLALKELPATALSVGGLILLIMAAPVILEMVKRGAITNIEAAGFKISLLQQTLSDLKPVACGQRTMRPLGLDDQDRIRDRFQRSAKALASTLVLWVDDEHPQFNVCERRVLQAAGVSVDIARTSDEATKWLKHSSFDLIISDFHGVGGPEAPCFEGQEAPASKACWLAKRAAEMKAPNRPRFIIYSRGYPPSYGTPPNVDRVMADPADLFHAVVDFAERKNEPVIVRQGSPVEVRKQMRWQSPMCGAGGG